MTFGKLGWWMAGRDHMVSRLSASCGKSSGLAMNGMYVVSSGWLSMVDVGRGGAEHASGFQSDRSLHSQVLRFNLNSLRRALEQTGSQYLRV